MVDEGVIVEIVRPGTGDPVADGEVGEVVVTTLNPDYPLIRFGTGDLSAVLPGACPTGRTNQRIRGWLGRADQSAKVRGMFVHPAQVAEIARRHPEVTKARLVVSGERADDRMSLRGRGRRRAPEGLAERIAGTIRDVTKLRGEVDGRRPGQPAERRQGDRGQAQVRLSAGPRPEARRRAAVGPCRSVGQLSILTLPSLTTLAHLTISVRDELANFSREPPPSSAP